MLSSEAPNSLAHIKTAYGQKLMLSAAAGDKAKGGQQQYKCVFDLHLFAPT